MEEPYLKTYCDIRPQRFQPWCAISKNLCCRLHQCIDTATDRSVLGTLNQSRFEFDFFLDDYSNVLDVNPLAAAKWFNHRPLTARGKWLWADDEMLALVSSL
ncbi:DUF6933 domain-containing protein [Trichlorobacter lovleyi]|uniref:DUF6933 domain-containing protein n=1 Tax=Trichlorobacter lovleyi (strain ATCC BAA-1151 / DSM 17278 / SZ) TaxID=398767 RepID=B3E7X5_TRIL1|nr:hypothetical protein [Trichlorobacter lovleyi]ACD96548.1 hypothetical protein Glov_2835 [Trichlorobacter lovleyi SZ]